MNTPISPILEGAVLLGGAATGIKLAVFKERSIVDLATGVDHQLSVRLYELQEIHDRTGWTPAMDRMFWEACLAS